MTKKIDFTEGPMLKKMLVYAWPIIASNILQLLFNAADTVVVGRFATNKSALPGVGGTTALIFLYTGLAIGISAGANIVLAKCVGERNSEKAKRVVGTSVFISVVLGLILAAVGFTFAETFLTWMDCPSTVIGLSALYVRIYSLGLPIILLYNFSASLLRAAGDTIRPLIFLVLSGVINVFLNLFFVIVMDMDVDGVAIATVVSQFVAAVFSIRSLLKDKDYSRLEIKYLKPDKYIVGEIFRIGIPAGIQSSLFSVSNVVVQTYLNSFGSELILSGNTIGTSLDGFLYNGMNAISLTTLTVIGQNFGALKFDRLKKSIFESVGLVTVIGIVMAAFMLIFYHPLCSIYTDDEEIIQFALQRLMITGTSYFLCGIMEVLANSLRGLGKSATAMIISFLGSCVFRIVWIMTVFKLNPTLTMLYIVYPISWFITPLTHSIFLFFHFRYLKREYKIDSRAAEVPDEA